MAALKGRLCARRDRSFIMVLEKSHGQGCERLIRERLALRQGQCAACGAGFHVPENGSRVSSLCPVCNQVNHYRGLFQVFPD